MAVPQPQDPLAHVVIPFQDRVDLTGRLVDTICDDPWTERLVLYDLGSTEQRTADAIERWQQQPKVTVRRRPPVSSGFSLYATWNEVWREALDAHPSGNAHLVALNNDIVIPAGFVGYLSYALAAAPPKVWVTYPDYDDDPADGISEPLGLRYTRGLWPRGLSGFAFALKVGARLAGLPYVDERFVLYCGDTELLWQVQARGYWTARVVGLPLDHMLGATRKGKRWVRRAVARDREFRRSKYPGGQASIRP